MADATSDSGRFESDTDSDEVDECANCAACVLTRMLDAVDEQTDAACCMNCVDGLVASLQDQMEMVKLMDNADNHATLMKKARVNVKLVPRRFARNQATRAKSDATIADKSAATARAAIEGVLSAARERDAAAKRAVHAKKKRMKAARQRVVKAAPPPPSTSAQPATPLAAFDDLGPDATLCVVCMERVKCVLHMGCGHVATCSSCAAQLTECPLCRAPIKIKSMMMEVRVF